MSDSIFYRARRWFSTRLVQPLLERWYASPLANGNGPKSNVRFWKELQKEDYFENHPLYGDIKIDGGEESVMAIERFLPLRADMKMAVIGCGYGRETIKLAPRVNRVYGIDVSEKILSKAVGFLNANGINNF